MEAIIDYLLKSAGVLSIFLLVYHFLLRRLTFFNANRWFLLAGIVASILFPLIEITQTVYVEQPEEVLYMPQQLATPMAMVLEQPPVEAIPFNYGVLAIYLYLAITLFFLGKMTVELSSLRSLIRSGTKKREGKFVFVSLSRKLTPFSFFNYICYSDNDLQSPELDLIIDHEKVHAKEWHSIDLLVSHVFRAVFWINPLVWLLKRQIGENLEFIADTKAKIQNKSGISYERTLLSTAASHMQPALANNFFTPFIKKRILMLQKEASARWNAYKYALILPVIVLFLYSFNVVEEIEYVEKNEASKEEKTSSVEKPNDGLIFDIRASTTKEQLTKYASQINEYANYQVRFSDDERNQKGHLTKLSISTKFPNKKWNKNLVINQNPINLLLLIAQKEILNISNDDSKEFFLLTDEGTEIKKNTPVLYGNNNIPKINNNPSIIKPISDHTISFKIDATSTKEDLIAMKKFFEEEYDIKFDYSKLRFKNDKIVRLKLSLDDKKGYKASKTDSDTDGIDPICVTAVVKGNVAKWDLGNCKENATNSYSFSTSSRFTPNGSIVKNKDTSMSTVNGQFKAYRMDSLVNKMQFHLTQMDLSQLDSLSNDLQIQMSKQNWDSIQADMQIKFKEMQSQLINMDSITYELKNIKFTDSVTEQLFKNGFSNIPTTSAQIRRGVVTSKDQPLIIINGKESTQEAMYTLNAQDIKSLTVLKDNESTSLYGKKGKNGVMVITTKPKVTYEVTSTSYEDHPNKPEGAGYAYINGQVHYYLAKGNNTEIYNRWGIKIFTIKGIMNGKIDLYDSIILENKELNVQVHNSLITLSDDDGNYYNGKGEVIEEPIIMRETPKEVLNALKRPTAYTYEVGVVEGSVKGDYSQTAPYNVHVGNDYRLQNMSKEGFTEFAKTLEDAGHTFKLKTHRMKDDRLVKLKYEINGSQHTYENNKGIKELSLSFVTKDATPIITTIPY
ncbi:M56 family metallopeptidase [Nonlabens sp.]|uniref:M56 family metallopeptidase n=1 Tax=Nonlabens sp. TaxID=1888209 RepID=UPI003F6A510F